MQLQWLYSDDDDVCPPSFWPGVSISVLLDIYHGRIFHDDPMYGYYFTLTNDIVILCGGLTATVTCWILRVLISIIQWSFGMIGQSITDLPIYFISIFHCVLRWGHWLLMSFYTAIVFCLSWKNLVPTTATFLGDICTFIYVTTPWLTQCNLALSDVAHRPDTSLIRVHAVRVLDVSTTQGVGMQQGP